MTSSNTVNLRCKQLTNGKTNEHPLLSRVFKADKQAIPPMEVYCSDHTITNTSADLDYLYHPTDMTLSIIILIIIKGVKVNWDKTVIFRSLVCDD